MFFHVWENIRSSIKSYRSVWVSRQNSRLFRQNGHFRQNRSFLFVHLEKKLNITYDSWITSYPYPHNFYQAFFKANVLRFLCYFAACSGIFWHFRILELVFVLEISLVRCAHSFDFWYVNNSSVNTVRTHFPWSFPYLHNFKQWLKIICHDKGYGKIIESECEATFTGQQTNFRPAEKFDRTLLGTLRSNDANGNESVKKTIGFISKTTTLHVHHAFFVHFFARFCTTTTWTCLFPFYGVRKQATTKFCFSFYTWIWSLGIQLQEGSPTFDKVSG